MTTDACREVIHAKDKRSTQAQVRPWTEQQGDCPGMLDRAEHCGRIPGKGQEERDLNGPWILMTKNSNGCCLSRGDFVTGTTRPIPDWAEVHKELKRKGVTLALLWQEYKTNPSRRLSVHSVLRTLPHLSGVGRSCNAPETQGRREALRGLCGANNPRSRSGNGQVREAQLFLAVLGASSYTYAEATWTQSLPDWIGSHVRALEYLGGVPEVVVPDNLKSGVTSPCRYEPELNPTYREFAAHYSVSVIPARVRKPRDKAKVENGVLQAERWILAPLRNRTFFDLAELNNAIREKLVEINQPPVSKTRGFKGDGV